MKSLLSFLRILFLSIFAKIKTFVTDAFALFEELIKVFEFLKLKVSKITENTRAVMHSMFMLPTLLRH